VHTGGIIELFDAYSIGDCNCVPWPVLPCML